LALSSVFFIFLQAGLGAGAVVWGQSDAILALHFGFSLTSFASVLLLTVRVYQYEGAEKVVIAKKPSSLFVILVWGLTLYSYVVVYLGAYVSHTGSASSCMGWPICDGGISLNPSEPAGIAFIHRLAAGLLFAGIVWMFTQARALKSTRKDLYWGAFFTLLFVTLQVLSGWILVSSNLHLLSQMLHNLIICLLFAALSFLCLQTYMDRSMAVDEDGNIPSMASPIIR
jgi:cytochrome c oxidase assembly protein subunit 15